MNMDLVNSYWTYMSMGRMTIKLGKITIIGIFGMSDI